MSPEVVSLTSDGVNGTGVGAMVKRQKVEGGGGGDEETGRLSQLFGVRVNVAAAPRLWELNAVQLAATISFCVRCVTHTAAAIKGAGSSSAVSTPELALGALLQATDQATCQGGAGGGSSGELTMVTLARLHALAERCLSFGEASTGATTAHEVRLTHPPGSN